jgi:hypothetical protein
MRVDFLTALSTARTEHESAFAAARKSHDEAERITRQDFLQAMKEQRADFVAERVADREMKRQLTETMAKLSEATLTHITEARAVWKHRGELA